MRFIVDPFLRWWLRSGRTGWSRFRRDLFERKYLEVPLPSVNSLENIEAALGRIKWQGDGPWYLFDCISYPQTTWVRKKDDCDGFASLAAELLSRWKPEYAPVLLTAGVWPIPASHTVCVFAADQGEMCFFDNATLRCESCHTYAEIVPKITGGNRLICWDVKDPKTLKTIEFHRA